MKPSKRQTKYFVRNSSSYSNFWTLILYSPDYILPPPRDVTLWIIYTRGITGTVPGVGHTLRLCQVQTETQGRGVSRRRILIRMNPLVSRGTRWVGNMGSLTDPSTLIRIGGILKTNKSHRPKSFYTPPFINLMWLNEIPSFLVVGIMWKLPKYKNSFFTIWDLVKDYLKIRHIVCSLKSVTTSLTKSNPPFTHLSTRGENNHRRKDPTKGRTPRLSRVNILPSTVSHFRQTIQSRISTSNENRRKITYTNNPLWNHTEPKNSTSNQKKLNPMNQNGYFLDGVTQRNFF